MMSQSSDEFLTPHDRSNWIRLRTLVILRWIAVFGQLAALTVAQRFFQLQLEIGLCFLAIGIAVVGNLVAVFIYPENKRLSETETVLMLVFDMLQLTFLLTLTGGLNNPFALLILAPVTIGATVLPVRTTVALASLAVVMISFIGMFHVPLLTADGVILQNADLFVFGFWLAMAIGICFIAFYTRRVTSEMHSMSDALLATQMALAREQKLTDLGGVVAAAAHELGTPLATIKLVSAELKEELKDEPDLFDDAELIREQADRCRDILRSMGRAGKDDLHLRSAPLEALVREAAEPHLDRGKEISFLVAPLAGGAKTQPTIRRQPEIIHGLRNLVQNAVDFARETVQISIQWTDTEIEVQIRDDGRGFSPQVIGRIGDPFVRKRSQRAGGLSRPGYEGMGLGLFIAKTLLERSGAELQFANGSDPYSPINSGALRGALVQVRWPLNRISAKQTAESGALGQNEPIYP